MKSRVRLILRPVAVSVVAALVAYGCGSGVVESVLGGGGGGITVAGAIANSPIDGAPLKATCADGTAGGTGVSVKGTYSMSVSCAATNFPVVISIDEAKIDNANPPMMAGADLQFCTAAEKTAGTCDDVPYKVTERAPLKVAVPSTAEAANVVNMNAVTTLAAQTIEDKTAAFVAAPTTAAKPTAADVQTAEAAIQTALGVPSVRNADPVRDAQVARVNSQVLEAVAVTKQLAGAAVKPEDVMKAVATAATTGAAGQALTKTETDGSKSFDITTAQTALTAAAAALTATDAATVARKTAVDAVNTAMTNAKAVEASIKGKGTAVEQIVKVVAQLPSVQAFDPLKNTLASGTIAADIKAALADTTNADNKAAKTATVTAGLVTQAIANAITKAQQIDADTTIASGEKSNRKKAVFEAAESIRASVANDIISAAATAAISVDQQAKAMAQVAMAVQVAGDQIKTATFANIVDTATNTVKPSIAGMAERISTDIATQIATQTAANLGDVNLINPTTVMGAPALTTMTTAAANVVTALANYVPPAGVDDSVVKVAVNAVIASMGATVDPTATAVQTNMQNTITSVANSLNTALGQQVTVGGVTSTMSALPEDSQLQLLAQTATTMMTEAAQTAGTTTLDFATPPQPGSVTTAVTGAVTTVNTTVVASLDSPTLTPATLADGAAVPGIESCSAEVKVSGINVGVPIKVMATVNGQPAGISAGDVFAAPPAPGETTQPSMSLGTFISVSGVGRFFPTPGGLLVGNVNNEQSFRLCVIPNAAGATFELSAQVGSRFDFATNQFADASKLKSIVFRTVTPATTTTTTTTTTTAAPTTTTTAAPTTTTTAAPTTTTTTAAPTTTTTTTTASVTTTTLGAAACKVTSGATTAFVTGAPSCASSGTGTLGLNGLTTTVTDSNVPAGVTAVAYSAITQSCDPFASPPSPGAAVSSLLCKN